MQLPGHRADAWPKVCLLATFRASSVRGWLPDILQHFCAAVHLHDMIAEEPDLYHAHTRPEWTPERSGRPNGWLIACSFSSKGHIQGRWQNRQRADPSSNSSFTVGAEDELMELVAVCVEKWLDWQQECAINRDAYKTYRADYEIWRKDPFYRARTMTANVSSPPRVSRRSSHEQGHAVASASPVRKGKNSKMKIGPASDSMSANRFAALADLSSTNETEAESSASTGSPASDTQETMSVELVREANMGETGVSRSASNEGDGKKKKRTLKGLTTITTTISRASMRK
ncbi:hypothetical protein OH76DRAFT_1556957 [Lentinus brumalis]|uniref:Uncharacterized protein n=1 Tax=Lentinus brumalis TaxID=2498619 RepID=A0A371D808_9APHY|nr:hypothetical protein OH76DRAFT_1556957 [Polyporus brumalis]